MIPIEGLDTTVEHAWPGDAAEIAIELAAGPWYVQAEASGLQSASGSAWLRDAEREPVRLELESPCRWIGSLLTAEGELAANVSVRVVASGSVLASAFSAADGSFELRAVPRPNVTLELGDRAREALAINLPADCRGAMSLDPIRLPPLARLTIEIDRRGYEQDAVQVQLQGPIGGNSVRRFGPGEPLQFDDLTPSRYRVFVFLPGLRGNQDVTVRAGTQAVKIPLRAWRKPTQLAPR